MNRDQIVSYALDRAREPSTWRGMVWMMTAVGITVSPEIAAHIAAAGMAVAGLIGALCRGDE